MTDQTNINDEAREALYLVKTLSVLDLRSQINKDAVVKALTLIVKATEA